MVVMDNSEISVTVEAQFFSLGSHFIRGQVFNRNKWWPIAILVLWTWGESCLAIKRTNGRNSRSVALVLH